MKYCSILGHRKIKIKSSRLNYIKRNEVLVNNSDFCLFYYDSNYSHKDEVESGIKIAYNYAMKKKKYIINICK